ncbi:hypothetical protein XENORESO_012793 [Xenotaenia resolanae]|uniref:Uncharacterized protein n=1 Tax=Xenotaenia resolanae TaxID=208358 RepID=A0ABV0VWL8_9TELE
MLRHSPELNTPEYFRKKFLSDLLWQVIEKVADDSTRQDVRGMFENVHGRLLDLILENTGELDLDNLSEMAEELGETIFQSICFDIFLINTFPFSTQLFLFSVLSSPQSYPRIVSKFKRHLENPLLKPTKEEKNLGQKIKDAFIGMGSKKKCLSETSSKPFDPNVRRSVVDGPGVKGRRGTQEERYTIIKTILWNMIYKSIAKATAYYTMDDALPVYNRLFYVIWDEIKDKDFIIFPEMEKRLHSYILQLLCGNNILVINRMFYLMRIDHPIIDNKIVTCFKIALLNPGKVPLAKKSVWRRIREALSSVVFCHNKVNCQP